MPAIVCVLGVIVLSLTHPDGGSSNPPAGATLTPEQQLAVFEIQNPEVSARLRQRTFEQFLKDMETISGFLNPKAYQQTLKQQLTPEQIQAEAAAASAILNPVAAKKALDQGKTPAQLEGEAAAIRFILNPAGKP